MTTQTTHTAQCNEAQAAVAAWKAEHPNYCHKCHGSGEVDASDPSVGIWGNEPCEHCVCEGRCPSCGHQHGEGWCMDEYEPCEACGFMVGTDFGCPEVDCDCGREAEEAEAEAARIRWEAEPVVLDDDFFRRSEDDYQASRDRGCYRSSGLQSSFRGRD